MWLICHGEVHSEVLARAVVEWVGRADVYFTRFSAEVEMGSQTGAALTALQKEVGDTRAILDARGSTESQFGVHLVKNCEDRAPRRTRGGFARTPGRPTPSGVLNRVESFRAGGYD